MQLNSLNNSFHFTRKSKITLLTISFALTALELPASTQHCHATVVVRGEYIQDWYNGISSTLGSDTLLGLNFNDQLFRATMNGPVSGVVETISKDAETGKVTLNLNPQCKWSNGDKISSSDVKAGIEAVFDPRASGAIPREGLFENGTAVLEGEMPITALGINTPDENTLEFQSELGAEGIKTLLSMIYYIPLPSEEMIENPDLPFSGERPDKFTGPYIVTEATPDRVELNLNPYFCGNTPAFDEVTYYIIKDKEDFAKLASEKDDLVFYAHGSAQEVIYQAEETGWLNDLFDIHPGQQSQVAFFRLNERNGPFQSHELRKAFAMAIDWEGPSGADARLTEVETLRTASKTLVPPSYMEDEPEYQRDLRPRQERIAEAKSILAENGYTDENPLMLKGAFTSYQADYFYLVKEMVEQDLPIVIEVTEIEEPSEYYQSVHLSESTDYDISLADWGIRHKWPYFYINFYFTNNTVTEAFYESGQPFIDIIQTSSDPDEVAQAERDAVSVILSEDIYIPFFLETGVAVMRKGVEKLGNSFADTVWDLAYVDQSHCEP